MYNSSSRLNFACLYTDCRTSLCLYAEMKAIDYTAPPPSQSVPSGEEQTDSGGGGGGGRLSFSSMCSDLPSKLTAEMKRNISVPIAFVCLLHLANEKVCSCIIRWCAHNVCCHSYIYRVLICNFSG